MSFLHTSLQLEQEEARQRAHIATSVQQDIRRLQRTCAQLRTAGQAPIVINKQALETLSRPKKCVVAGEVEHALFDVTEYAKWAAAELEKENEACEKQMRTERQRQLAQQQQLEAWRKTVHLASQAAQQAARERQRTLRRRQKQAATNVEQRAAVQLAQYAAAAKLKRDRAALVHAAHTAHFTCGGCPGKPQPSSCAALA